MKEGLKNDYANFYYNIGSKILTQNSGHFVASKYSITAPRFMSFSSGRGLQSMVNKGLFSFSVNSKDQKFADIYAVHLSPSKDDLAASAIEIETRQMELEKIEKQIELNKEKHPLSYQILLGDMNLTYKSKEWEKSIISSDKFFDPYNHNRKDIKPIEATCATDDMIKAYHKGQATDWFKSAMILDYALFYKRKSGSPLNKISTSIFRAFDPDKDPYNALSDHNGLVVTIPAD